MQNIRQIHAFKEFMSFAHKLAGGQEMEFTRCGDLVNGTGTELQCLRIGNFFRAECISVRETPTDQNRWVFIGHLPAIFEYIADIDRLK